MLPKPYENVLAAIGNTPMVKLMHVSALVKADIYAKLEFLNPGGSVKDRIAKYMVEKAERLGAITPGATIVENSSGNTAIGLAMVARQKGYKAKIIMRDSTSREKIEIVRTMGAEVVLVDATLPPENPRSYNNIAPAVARETAGAFFPDQHNNLDNNETHYMTTGPEIWQQMDGRIDYFITGIGTGGTVCGAGRYLKEQDPRIQVIAIDPLGSIFHDYYKTGQRVTPKRYLIEGLGDEFLIKCAQLDMLDDIIQVTDKIAFTWTRKLARMEGLITGGSSGANVWGALQLAQRIDRPARIVTLLPDSGYRYLSTIYNDIWLKQKGFI